MINDLETGELVAQHLIHLEKGQIIKNTDHYRDKAQRIEALEADILQCLAHSDNSVALCALLKTSSPKIYKDQLLGARQVLNAHIAQYGEIDAQLVARLIDTPRLTATGLRDRLDAYQQSQERGGSEELPENLTTHADQTKTGDSLARYGALNGQPSGQGESHVIH